MSIQFHPNNQNLRLLVDQDEWNGLEIFKSRSGMIESYLSVIHQKLIFAKCDYTRVSMMRLDLHFPLHIMARTDTHVISRFFDALRFRINHDQAKKNKKGQRVHKCKLRYIWVREKDISKHQHYHIAIILNYDSYFKLGKFKTREKIAKNLVSGTVPRENMHSRICDSWASALGIKKEDALGLINVPDNSTYKIDSSAENADDQFREAFRRLSYFAKAQTKIFGDNVRNFGCNRD